MHKETSSAKVGMGVIVLFILLAVFLKGILGVFPLPPLIIDVAYMVAMVAFVLILIKRYMCSYEYELTDDSLIITTVLGGRERSKTEVALDTVEMLCESDEKCIKAINAPTRVLCAASGRRYSIVCAAPDGRVKIVFAPSAELTGLINDKLNFTSEEESK